jgi:hypothetical protein
MKIFLFTFLILWTTRLCAQNLTGVLLDKATGKPIAYAGISTYLSATFSAENGLFILNNVHARDTIKITCIGYRPLKLTAGSLSRDTLRVYMEQNSIMLRNVTISAKRDYQFDSIRMRKEFSGVFNYKGASLKNAIVNKSSLGYTPNNYTTGNNATQLATVDLLSIASFLSRKKTPTAKLQQTMLRDEKLNYVDQRFSREKITSLTQLKGDSLTEFIDRYRPSIEQIKAMSDYDFIFYVRNSFTEFKQTYKKDQKSILIK